MKRLYVGDLATLIYSSEYSDEDLMDCIGSIVKITEVTEDYRYWDYFIQLPDGRIIEVHEDELEPIFNH